MTETSLSKASSRAEITAATKGTSTFHPALSLLHGQSKVVMDQRGVAGNFFCDDHDLGNDVLIVILSFRWHAIYLKNEEKVMETFDFNSPYTARIMKKRRNYNEKEDPRYGYSWLIWLPAADNAAGANLVGLSKFCVFHPNVWSSRPVSGTLYDHFLDPAKREQSSRDLPHTNVFRLTAYLKQGKFPHFVPTAKPEPPDDVNMLPADRQALSDALHIFEEPVLNEPDTVEDSSVPDR